MAYTHSRFEFPAAIAFILLLTLQFFSYVDNKGKDDEEKILEEEVEPAPVRRIMKLNTKEWPYLLSGSVAAIINGLFPFAFALLLSEILFVSESIFFCCNQI